ncbi:MAG: aminotransferase class I/II-fold pyridoxal phosphate-dependent enzyme [Armatimonadota bacterium]|nr:aminotransferase class I/II-fold pyridoxal phosphate-dependent enzyme [Armatimonadota bacterium]MDR7549030.1 aminotransferase class I/II-fold pyridoxal phosphate-dependent enzyme [Armatimonadota bacterium]
MKPLSRRAQGIQPSGIRQMMERARQIPDVVHLEVGEPDSNTPDHIIQAAAEAARAGFTKYTPSAGLPSLREALARKLSVQNGLPTHADQVVVAPGSVFALAAAMLATVDPDDEVLVPDPGWPNYTSVLQVIGARIIPYPLPRLTGYLPDLAALRRLVTPRTKAMIVNSPSNPTGAVFPRETVQALSDVAVEYDLYLIADEVYEEFVFEGEHVSPALFDSDGRVISVFGFSKTYAMTGWRLGYARAATAVAEVMTRLAEPFVSCPSSVAQKAAEAALAGPRTDVERMREFYRRRRDTVVAILGPEGLLAAVPRGAFYALVDLSRLGADSVALAGRLLEEHHVATVPGEAFGRSGAGLVRISFAAEPRLLEEGCRRIVQFATLRVGV